MPEDATEWKEDKVRYRIVDLSSQVEMNGAICTALCQEDSVRIRQVLLRKSQGRVNGERDDDSLELPRNHAEEIRVPVLLYGHKKPISIRPQNLRPVRNPTITPSASIRVVFRCPPLWAVRKILRKKERMIDAVEHVLSFLTIKGASSCYGNCRDAETDDVERRSCDERSFDRSMCRSPRSTSVRAICASSEASPSYMYSFRKESLCTMDSSDCWISAPGSFPNGRGHQGVVFDMGRVVQISQVRISIPPLPSGPLSVRKFRVEACYIERTSTSDVFSDEAHERLLRRCGFSEDEIRVQVERKRQAEGGWAMWKPKAASRDLFTLDVEGPQPFAIHPPLETRYVRLVCLSTAQAHGHPGYFFPDGSVGLWGVKFMG